MDIKEISDNNLAEASEIVKQIERLDNWERWKDDPVVFMEECLLIYPKDPSLGLVPLKLNSAQKIVVKEFVRQMKEDKRVRLIISKYRQAGFSTVSSALIFHRALFFDNTKAVIIAHDKPTTESIFGMSQTFWENLPKGLQPSLSKANRRELNFKENNSAFSLFTAGADDPGRGTTNNCLLADEVGFYTKGEKVLAGLFQSVPLVDGSIIIINSTSNGAAGMYYDLWNKAERGEGQFKPVFVPWYLQDEYRLNTPGLIEPTLDEQKLIEEYGLDSKQIYWRRIKVSEIGLQKFRQEYPFTAEESFTQSGSNVFDLEVLSSYIPEAPESLRGYNKDYSSFDIEDEGNLRVWLPPKKNSKYLIGADVGGGVGGDYSVATVMNSDKEVVAIYKDNKIDPARFGSLLFYLGRWYNNCLIAPESNSIGLVVVQQLHTMGYPNIYKQKKTANATIDGINAYGFRTTSGSKQPLIAGLQGFIKNYEVAIPCQEMIDELKNFVVVTSDAGNIKMRAAIGKHDDMVMSLAITLEAWRTDHHTLTNSRYSFGEKNFLASKPVSNWL